MFKRRMTPACTVDAIEKHLPAEAQAIHTVANALNISNFDREEQRRTAYDELAPPILNSLGKDADRLLAELFTEPASYEVHGNDQRDRAAVNRFAGNFACAHLQFHPTEYAAARLIARLRWMFDTAGGPHESKYLTYSSSPEARFMMPDPVLCLYVLSAHAGLGEADTFLEDVLAGKFDRRIEVEGIYSGSLYHAFFRSGGLMRTVFDRTMQRRNDRGELSYEFFRDTMNAAPKMLVGSRMFSEYDKSSGLDAAYIVKYCEYGKRFLSDTVDGLPATAEVYNRAFCGTARLSGIHWICRGLDKISEIGVKAKDLRREYEAEPDTLKGLVSSKLADGETEEQLVEMLKGHDEATLVLALPYACHSRVAILKALGWDDIVPVQDMIFGIAGNSPYDTCGFDNISNCEDPSSGVLDRQQCLAVIGAADEKRVKNYLNVIRAWGGMRKTMTLIDALRGEGRDRIDRALKKHGQIATKALGMFPVQSDAELRERYLKFKQIHKEVAKYGSERQANSRAAVQAGLRNLAKAAGYPDEVRMEWELESGLAESMTGLDDWHDIEQWRVRLELEGTSATIRVEKKGKLLKSVPPKVRKTDYYKKLRENQDILRGQARRFRKTLKNMMCTGEEIDADLLGLLKKHPALRAMIRQLILVNADGGIGTYNDDLTALQTLDGADLAETLPIRIAHVLDLYTADQLPDWQKYIVGGHIVQPFKQAFRELYVTTPAEESAAVHSTRFSGHVVNSGVAGRLLQSRGWSQGQGDTAYAHKYSDKHNLSAHLVFIEWVRYFLEQPELTIDLIEFRRGPNVVEITEIDPLLFSETMRDADLVAAVAQASDEEDYGRVSAEVLAHRSAVLGALLREIGLDRVSCRDKFAHVQGKLASYRVHLASGVIHIEPGNYLCIVPKEANKTDVYLPFADTDKKMAEIVSKVLLLLNDDQITDTSILSQIDRATAAPA